MNSGIITSVGIDISKHKSTVAVRRPGGEIVLMPFDTCHNVDGITSFIKILKSLDGEIRVVM